jgi:hypothetical protein
VSRVIRKNLGPFAAIGVLIALAAVVGAYILDQQRFRFPFVDPTPFRVNVQLATAQAVTPGPASSCRTATRSSRSTCNRATPTSSTATRARCCARARD